MSRNYCNLSALVAAAAACDCTAHTHQDRQGNTVYSIGSEEIGAAEFQTYTEALDWATNRATYTAADCAEQAGNTIANSLLNDLLAADNQALRGALIKAAILNLATLQHHDRAADGFAVGIVNVLETGLNNLQKVAE